MSWFPTSTTSSVSAECLNILWKRRTSSSQCCGDTTTQHRARLRQLFKDVKTKEEMKRIIAIITMMTVIRPAHMGGGRFTWCFFPNWVTDAAFNQRWNDYLIILSLLNCINHENEKSHIGCSIFSVRAVPLATTTTTKQSPQSRNQIKCHKK